MVLSSPHGALRKVRDHERDPVASACRARVCSCCSWCICHSKPVPGRGRAERARAMTPNRELSALGKPISATVLSTPGDFCRVLYGGASPRDTCHDLLAGEEESHVRGGKSVVHALNPRYRATMSVIASSKTAQVQYNVSWCGTRRVPRYRYCRD